LKLLFTKKSINAIIAYIVITKKHRKRRDKIEKTLRKMF